MQTVKIQCPAKINLSLKVVNKRPDGFHNIESVMQTIGLYDYLTVTMQDFDGVEIVLSGNSTEIPYDERNLVYKAAEMFIRAAGLKNKKISVYIEKNIPISAGLAGGSTDAAGILYGLNLLCNEPFSEQKLHNLCSKLGSDLNFCLKGGCMLTKGRGEILEPYKYEKMSVSLIKPLNLGISAKEAYTKFSQKNNANPEGKENFANDLEWALLDDYEELKFIKSEYPESVMTGSGSTYFILGKNFTPCEGYWVKNGLETVPCGVRVAQTL